ELEATTSGPQRVPVGSGLPPRNSQHCVSSLPAGRRGSKLVWARGAGVPARRAKSAQQARERLKPIQRGTAKPLHGLCHARSRFAKLRGIADLPGNAQTRRGAASGFTKSIKLRKRPEPVFIAGFSIQQWLAESTFLHVQPSHLRKEAKEHLHLG